MRVLEYIVPKEYDGRKLVHFLRGQAGCSYTLVRSLKAQPGCLLRNGEHIRTIDPVRVGDRITLKMEEPSVSAEPWDHPLPILYEDEDIIVYDKPPAMACHPVRNLQQGTLANVYSAHCPGCGCHILNRLDRDTTGAVLIGKNTFAAAALTGKVQKVYLAVVSGKPVPPTGRIEAPIGQPDRTNPRRAVMEAGGQWAATRYETLWEGEEYSLLACVLESGRTHQIRVHMSYMGHPLLGDALYGGSMELIQRQALHCVRLTFPHPVKKEQVEVTASVPQDIQKILGKYQFPVKYR